MSRRNSFLTAAGICPLLLLVGCTLVGCTLVNAPDRDKLRFDGGPDAERDGGPDADAELDGGPDASDGGDGGDGGPVEICDNGEDDDGDGLIDCEDYDCASDETGGCCDNDVPDITLDVMTWPTDLEADWDATRRVDGLPLFPRVESGVLTFERSTDPHALVYEACVPLGLGATLRADFGPRGDTATTSCDAEGRCREFAALVLSPVAEQRLPRRLAAELAITMHASGRLDVSQDATLLATTTLDPLPSRFYEVDVELLVDVDAAGRGVLRADVSVKNPSGMEMFAWSAPLISLRNLFFDRAECADSAGLRLAIEGAGRGVDVGITRAAKLACTNPGEFLRRELDPLTAGDVPGVITASLNFDDPSRTPRWADEALMSASLLGVARETMSPTWHVAAEATNDQPELVTTARVGWSIGYAFEDMWNVETWSNASQAPVLGARPPSCLDGTCSGPRPAAREPHLFLAGGGVNVVYAAEQGTSERFELRFAQGVRADVLESRQLLTPAQETECDSLRDPAIVPRIGVTNGYWLFFTCERDGRSSIRLRGLMGGVGLNPAPEPSVEVLASDDLGDFARDGVRSPEPVLDGNVYRVWFLGLDDVAGPSVGVALGSPKGAAPNDVPVLVPYPANPILRSSDPPFADCLGCALEGIAVARHPDNVDRLRFLVTRRVPLVGGGRRFDLIALDQTWRASRED